MGGTDSATTNTESVRDGEISLSWDTPQSSPCGCITNLSDQKSVLT